MKRLIAGATTALLVGSVGGFGRHVATSGPGLRDSPTPFPVGENSTAKIVYALGGARLPAFNWTYDTNRGGGGFFPGGKRGPGYAGFHRERLRSDPGNSPA